MITTQNPKLVYGGATVFMGRGESFGVPFIFAGRQSVAYARGGQAAVAVWNATPVYEYTPGFKGVGDDVKQDLDAFFGASGVNFMEHEFTYYPDANNPREYYTMRLLSADGYKATEAKSGQGRRLWDISIAMRGTKG